MDSHKLRDYVHKTAKLFFLYQICGNLDAIIMLKSLTQSLNIHVQFQTVTRLSLFSYNQLIVFEKYSTQKTARQEKQLVCYHGQCYIHCGTGVFCIIQVHCT